MPLKWENAMSTPNGHDELYESELDRATASRLARLKSVPVDTSRLDRLVRAQIPQSDRRSLFVWMKPLRAVAASLIVLVTIAAILLSTSGGPVLASAVQMARMHEDLVAGRTTVMKVD